MNILTDGQVANRQEMSSAAPDGTTLWFLSGIAQINNFQVSSNTAQQASSKESYRLLLGPALAGAARAIATASAATVAISATTATYSVVAIEADLDDESGRVQLMFEVSGTVQPAQGNTTWQYVRVQDVAYQVTIHGTAAG